MTQNDYERSKERLEEQRRSGVELVEAAYQAQLRALELVWMLQSGIGNAALFSPAPASTAPPAPPAAAPEPPPPAVERPRRRSAYEVEDDVRAVLSRLPESFTRRDVSALLGYEPDRGALYRNLQRLTEEGLLRITSRGEGQRATVYCKTGGEPSQPQA